MNRYNGLKLDMSFEETRNNCYTYAINMRVNPYTRDSYDDWEHVQPGNLGGKGKNRGTHGVGMGMVERAREDLTKLGYELVDSTYEEYMDDPTCWKVAFLYEPWGDYHWLRQHSDGTWSHKRGPCEVTDKDFEGNLIFDPRKGNFGKYEVFGGFYMLRKIATSVDSIAS